MANESRVSELILRLRDEVSAGAKSASGSLGSLQSKLTSFAGALGIGLGAGALVSFGKSVIDAAGHLQDLSNQTGISAQTLSGIKSTLEESGTSVDAFAKGIFTAQKNIGEGSEQTSQAVLRLGLDFNQLKVSSPERFLQLVAGALGKIEDPIIRNALGAQLLGGAFKELSPALSEIAGKLDELRAKGMTDADIKKLDEFGEAITRLINKAQIAAAAPVSIFTDFITNLFDPEKFIKEMTNRFSGAAMTIKKRLSEAEEELDKAAVDRLRKTEVSVIKPQTLPELVTAAGREF